MNVLITGATGFIGKELVRRLTGENNSVAVLVRDKRKAEERLPEASGIFAADLTDRGKLEVLAPLIKNADVVIHLAACIDYNAGKEALFGVNVAGTANILELAGKLGAKKFVYISSIEAIGPVSAKEVPAGETQPCRPANLYGESKLEAEKLALRAGAGLKMEVVILRLGNVYGPGSPSFVRPVAEAVLAANKAWLYLNWKLHRWHPVYIDDAVAGIAGAAAPNVRGGVYIMAGGEIPTVGRLAEAIARELGVDLETRKESGLSGIFIRFSETWARLKAGFGSVLRPRNNWAYSIEKARRELGYAPQVSLEDGVRRTIEWAKKEGLPLK
ncbi:MAG: hypothetical protein A2X28_06000 [Elusimicrobia bacterium GWA2_56_46]|nr:MAG: hypothetical protein A2X28_06000 [Elusimicrobia bacterium GWA2_56_46]OGR54584.1 MAG: hypothetical protein A2X39_02050 [Elusimicrobia bacterium GWC2_56_31]HBB65748.1 hypothetical protein [Elusimicrobiota bacterium]HBW23934.1 hypothetical protein [Elusimicrobiota bacterium]